MFSELFQLGPTPNRSSSLFALAAVVTTLGVGAGAGNPPAVPVYASRAHCH